jgi:hypothetical protein
MEILKVNESKMNLNQGKDTSKTSKSKILGSLKFLISEKTVRLS